MRARGKRGRGESVTDSFPPPPSTSSLVPPPRKSGEKWTKVLGRKSRKGLTSSDPLPDLPRPSLHQDLGRKGKKKAKAPTKERPATRLTRAPRTAAIILTAPEGQYAEVMRLAREISLADLDIQDLTARRAMTGAMKIETPGKDGQAKASRLAEKMADVLAPKGVKVVCPAKCADLRIRGLDDSATPAAVSLAIAQAGECSEGAIKVGEIRRSPLGTGTMWVQCPLNVARKLVQEGNIRVGWFKARIEVLPTRPLRCFRCLETGHTAQRCNSMVDRSGRCYRCGDASHRSSRCSAGVPRCPLCTDLGRPAEHRLGGAACAPTKSRRVGNVAKTRKSSPEKKPRKPTATRGAPKKGAPKVVVTSNVQVKPPMEKEKDGGKGRGMGREVRSDQDRAPSPSPTPLALAIDDPGNEGLKVGLSPTGLTDPIVLAALSRNRGRGAVGAGSGPTPSTSGGRLPGRGRDR